MEIWWGKNKRKREKKKKKEEEEEETQMASYVEEACFSLFSPPTILPIGSVD